MITPSLAEGFDVPIIEAFASNVRVLCFDIAVCREVARDLAIYFDPRSSSSMRDAVLEAVATERTLRERIAARRADLVRRLGTLTHAEDILAPCPPPATAAEEFYFAGSPVDASPAIGAP